MIQSAEKQVIQSRKCETLVAFLISLREPDPEELEELSLDTFS